MSKEKIDEEFVTSLVDAGLQNWPSDEFLVLLTEKESPQTSPTLPQPQPQK